MNKDELKSEMMAKGMSQNFVDTLLDKYSEISPFSYRSVKSLDKHKYKTAFGEAYSRNGIYIFYKTKTLDIKYIGEAATEPFSKRWRQHFNRSHGGLLYKKHNALAILESCDVLILYLEHNLSQARDIHFDEDLLIGTFRPCLNNR